VFSTGNNPSLRGAAMIISEEKRMTSNEKKKHFNFMLSSKSRTKGKDQGTCKRIFT